MRIDRIAHNLFESNANQPNNWTTYQFIVECQIPQQKRLQYSETETKWMRLVNRMKNVRWLGNGTKQREVLKWLEIPKPLHIHKLLFSFGENQLPINFNLINMNLNEHLKKKSTSLAWIKSWNVQFFGWAFLWPLCVDQYQKWIMTRKIRYSMIRSDFAFCYSKRAEPFNWLHIIYYGWFDHLVFIVSTLIEMTRERTNESNSTQKNSHEMKEKQEKWNHFNVIKE